MFRRACFAVVLFALSARGVTAVIDKTAANKSAALEKAYQYVERSKDKFGLSDPRNELREKYTNIVDDRFISVTFLQYWHELRVYPGELSFFVASDGNVSVANDLLVRKVDVPTTVPKVLKAEAEQIALKAVGVTTAEKLDEELIILCLDKNGKPATCALAWSVNVGGTEIDRAFAMTYWINATTGEVIASMSRRQEAAPSNTPTAVNATLKAMYSGPWTIALYKSGSYVYLQDPYLGTALGHTNDGE